jgi:hypothetical protein
MDGITQIRLLWLAGTCRLTCGGWCAARTHGPFPSHSRSSRGDCEVSRPAASPRPPNGHQGRGHRVRVPPAPLVTGRAGESERGPLSGEIGLPSAFTGNPTGW